MPPDLEPPDGLPPDQAAIWRETITDITDAGTIFRLDLNALHAYVAAVANHRRATQLLNSTDVLIDRDGHPAPNPALTIQTQAAHTIATLAKQFGLTRHRAAPAAETAPTAPHTPMRDQPPMREDRGPDPSAPGRWCPVHGRYECTGNRKRGQGPCHGIARATGLCRMHPGDTRTSQAKIAAAKLVRKARTYGEPVDVSPGEALLQEVQRTAGIVGWLGEVIAGLEDGEVVWGIERRTDRSGGDWPGADVITSARPNVWVQLYQGERRHLVQTCEAALRANVDERLVRLAEMQGGRIVAALNGIFTDLGLDDRQRDLLPEVVPRRLRELVA